MSIYHGVDCPRLTFKWPTPRMEEICIAEAHKRRRGAIVGPREVFYVLPKSAVGVKEAELLESVGRPINTGEAQGITRYRFSSVPFGEVSGRAKLGVDMEVPRRGTYSDDPLWRNL